MIGISLGEMVVVMASACIVMKPSEIVSLMQKMLSKFHGVRRQVLGELGKIVPKQHIRINALEELYEDILTAPKIDVVDDCQTFYRFNTEHPINHDVSQEDFIAHDVIADEEVLAEIFSEDPVEIQDDTTRFDPTPAKQDAIKVTHSSLQKSGEELDLFEDFEGFITSSSSNDGYDESDQLYKILKSKIKKGK